MKKKTDNKNDKKETILKKLANVYAANIMLLHTLSYLAPLLASIHEEKWKLITVKLILLDIVVIWQRKSAMSPELPLCAGSEEGCQWQALPSLVQCEETATRTRDLLVTGGKTLPLAPGPPFIYLTKEHVLNYEFLTSIPQLQKKLHTNACDDNPLAC